MLGNMACKLRLKRSVGCSPHHTEAAYHKAHTLLQAGCAFSDFGTRRRRSFAVQDLVIQAIVSASRDVPGKGALLGTSNVSAIS